MKLYEMNKSELRAIAAKKTKLGVATPRALEAQRELYIRAWHDIPRCPDEIYIKGIKVLNII